MCMGSWQQKHFRKSTLIPLLSKSTCYHSSYRFQRKNVNDVSCLHLESKSSDSDGEICVPFAMFSSGFVFPPLPPMFTNTRSYAQF